MRQEVAANNNSLMKVIKVELFSRFYSNFSLFLKQNERLGTDGKLSYIFNIYRVSQTNVDMELPLVFDLKIINSTD